MAYLSVIVALLCLTVKGVFGKKVGNYMRNTGDSFLFNLLRMLMCLLIGAGIVLAERAESSLSIHAGMLAICLLSGAANALFLVAWILAIRRNAMVTVDVALTVGSLLPAVLCAILFGEAISGARLIGYALILLATAILSGYNKATAPHAGVLGAFLVLLAALGDGMSGFAQQLYKQYFTESGLAFGGTAYPLSVFHFYTYVFASLLLLLFFVGYTFLFGKKDASASDGEQASVGILRGIAKPLPLIAVMAVCMFAANWLQTLATNRYGMPSQILYPLIKGGCLITVNVTAMLFFHEKITRRSVCGSLTALLGIAVMNL